jgi:glycosyltransferase involved in cell wall biosynthesis
MPLGRLIKRVGRRTLNAAYRTMARTWRPYSRLMLADDSPIWVLAWEMRELAGLARRMGVKLAAPGWVDLAPRQVLFFASHFSLLLAESWPREHRVGTTYYHGKPGTGVPEFDATYESLCRLHPRIQRIQVSHSEMRDVVLSSGVAPEKVFLIPIGINLSFFRVQTPESRRQARARLDIPESAVVLGSFQKDGVGWGEGLEPKLIKGPDVFLKAVERLRTRVPELFVLLSGPARGYVKTGLERLRVPYKHLYLDSYPEVGQLFQALDVYIVAARQEGGPKAVLESMASGVPLVTTRVGQAMDLVRHCDNGWMVESEDFEGLAHWAEEAVSQTSGKAEVLARGLLTAQANTYDSQFSQWLDFMTGFVNFDRWTSRCDRGSRRHGF